MHATQGFNIAGEELWEFEFGSSSNWEGCDCRTICGCSATPWDRGQGTSDSHWQSPPGVLARGQNRQFHQSETDGDDTDGPGSGSGHPDTHPHQFSSNLLTRKTCTIELLCGELFGWTSGKQPPKHYLEKPLEYKGIWHCEFEVVNCDGGRMRYGVIGGNGAEEVIGKDGKPIVSANGIKQRAPTPSERNEKGEHSSPWVLTFKTWEFECSESESCDFTLYVKNYPYIDDTWNLKGPNCMTFALWVAQQMNPKVSLSECPGTLESAEKQVNIMKERGLGRYKNR